MVIPVPGMSGKYFEKERVPGIYKLMLITGGSPFYQTSKL